MRSVLRQRPYRRQNGEPGQIRIRLARKLAQAGYDIQPEDLHSATGYNRIQQTDDTTLTWEGWGTERATGRSVHLVSYTAMTELLREGFTVNFSDGPYGDGFTWVDSKSWCRVCNRECHCPWQDNDEHHCRHKESRLDK